MTGSNPLATAPITSANALTIQEAVSVLRCGGLVAVPTETVYGLAADARNAEAVAHIYRTKERPDFNPLIVHVPETAEARRLGQFDARAEKLASTFWPGPLTMVLPICAGADVATAVTAGLPTIALRCPAHPVMQRLLIESGLSLAAPSANKSGQISPTRAGHVAASLGPAAPMIIDGGPCTDGLESTIVALRQVGWQLLREGPVTALEIECALGEPALPLTDQKIEAPGMLARHYAPRKPLRLDAQTPAINEWHIGFGAVNGDDNLSPTGDLAEAASRLFDALHQADQSLKDAIAIAPVPQEAIGAAINDRLKRAAER